MIAQAVTRWAAHARAFVLCWAVIAILSSELLAEERLLIRFRQEAPVQWKKYRELAVHSAGSCKVTDRYAREGIRRVEQAEDLFSIDGNSARVISAQIGTDKLPRCEAVNPDYAFSLSRNTLGAWKIQQVEFAQENRYRIPDDLIGGESIGSDGSLSPEGDYDAFGMAIKLACRGMILQATWFPRMVESHEFEVSRISKVDDKENLVKLEFTYDPKMRVGNDAIGNGWVILDPNRYWLIREAEVNCHPEQPGDAGTITIRNEFDDHMMPFPVIKRQVQRTRYTRGGVVGTSEATYVCESHAPPKDQGAYRLSAFGLPEPDSQPASKQRKD